MRFHSKQVDYRLCYGLSEPNQFWREGWTRNIQTWPILSQFINMFDMLHIICNETNRIIAIQIVIHQIAICFPSHAWSNFDECSHLLCCGHGARSKQQKKHIFWHIELNILNPISYIFNIRQASFLFFHLIINTARH